MEKSIEELVFVVEEAPEGGYTAKALGVSIISEADDLDSLKRQIIDAVDCHFLRQTDRPRIIRLHMVKDEVFAA
jgi:hypothetical protein